MDKNDNSGIESEVDFSDGNSMASAIVIKRSFPNDYVGKEYAVIKSIKSKQLHTWKPLYQELIFKDGKTYDILTIETKPFYTPKGNGKKETYYFDITDCYGDQDSEKDAPDEDQLLEQIVDRIEILIAKNCLTRKCIEKLRDGTLNHDFDSFQEFVDVIWEDECLPLFKNMLVQYGKCIMDLVGPISEKLSV